MKDAVLKNICRNNIYYTDQKAKHPYKSHFGLYKIYSALMIILNTASRILSLNLFHHDDLLNEF